MPQNKKIADKDEILEYLTKVIRDEGSNLKDKLSATRQLGKYLGLDVRKIELDGKAGVIIYDDIRKAED